MSKAIITLIIILICFNFIIINTESIKFQATESKKLDSGFYTRLQPIVTDQSYGMPNSIGDSEMAQGSNQESSGSSRTIINEKIYSNYYQKETYPLEVSKYIVSHNIDAEFNSDIVCILVKITNTAEKSIDNIEVREVTTEGLKIINCSVPIKSSSTREKLRYMRGGSRLFSAEDISMPKSLICKATCNDSPIQLDFNPDYIDNIDEYDDSTITKIILNEFNKIAAHENLIAPNSSINERFLSQQTIKLMQIDYRNELQKVDRQLLNFLLLRDLFESHIKKPEDYIEICDKHYIDEISNTIYIPITKIRPSESVLFIYYANISNHQPQKSDTIIDILNNKKYPTSQSPLFVTFPNPKFVVRGDISKQEIEPGEPVTIKYIVDLLIDENVSYNYRFNGKIEHDKQITIDPNDLISLGFLNGSDSCNKTITIVFDEPGTYNIPSISIQDNEYFVLNNNIKVEPGWHTYIFEITIMFLAVCTLVGNNFSRLEKNRTYRVFFLILFGLISCLSIHLCNWTYGYILCIIISILVISIAVYWWEKSLDK